MSKITDSELEELAADYQDEIGDEDYGFVFDAEGNLKFAFAPDILPDKPPKNIAKIMKMLGIIDLAQFNEDITLH